MIKKRYGVFFFQAEDGIRDLVRSRGLGDVYKRQVLENVDMDIETRKLDLDSSKFTENTRGAYPLDFIDNAVPSASAGHPRNIVMLTADAVSYTHLTLPTSDLV